MGRELKEEGRSKVGIRFVSFGFHFPFVYAWMNNVWKMNNRGVWVE